MEATLQKYTIKAPFSGVVTRSDINPGTLVRMGQKLGEFTNTALYELEAPVGLGDVKRLRSGQSVSLTTEDVNGNFQGHIQRINSVIDRNSMTVKVYIHVSGPALRAGMYMTGSAIADSISGAFPLSKDLLMENDMIFTVENGKLVKRRVEIVAEKGDHIIVHGLKDGLLILGEPWPGAAEGVNFPRPESSPSSREKTVEKSTGYEKTQQGNQKS
jgi:multidrug efflux pump subunit AcrA (membrane-fusion protein)